jgi:hypothetical protein
LLCTVQRFPDNTSRLHYAYARGPEVDLLPHW